MEAQVNSKNFIIKYGVILGIANVLIDSIVYATGNKLNPHWSVTAISGLLFVGLIILGIKKFKQANTGFLSWGQSVRIGVGIAIVSALIMAIYSYIFMTFIDPNFISQLMDLQKQKLIAQGASQENIEAATKMTKYLKSPTMMVAIAILYNAFIGFVISAIAGAIMMKKPNPEQY